MNRPRSRHLSRLLLVLAAVAVSTLGLLTPATAAAPYCGLTWGSLPKAHDTHADTDQIYDVRAGRHACYDRLVIDLGGQDTTFGSYDVRYVQQVTNDPKGDPVALRGGAALQVIARAPAYDEHGPTYLPANPREVVAVSGFSTFRQVAWAGSFEGQTTLGVGVRARLPFRVLAVTGTPDSDNGPKLVIDVAHRW
jgi:hypothetical protein